MDFEEEFRKTANRFDLNIIEQARTCHQECHEFAKKEITNILRRNEFMHYCSERLQQPWIHEIIFPPIAGGEQLLVDVYDNRIIVCANKPGLKYLASVATTLSNSNLSGEHIHVEQDDEVKVISDYEFEFMYRNDDWFTKYGKKTNKEKVFQQRNIVGEDVSAIIFLSPVPPVFSSNIEQFETYGITRVVQFTELSPSKKIRDNVERMLNVSLIGRNRVDFSINVDIDDLDIVLLTKKQIKELLEIEQRNA